jgi:DNA-binding winged helix-turn-helix (wHTH) protein/predicted ATPase
MNTSKVFKFGVTGALQRSKTVHAEATGHPMERAHCIAFGPFRLDTTHACLWREEQVLTLRPRVFAVLRYLAERPGRLVTKAELRQHVWAGTSVTDTVLRVCIREIRAVLGDSAEAPQYLQTVGGRGYRFLVPRDGSVPPLVAAGPIVGRQHEVEALETWFQRAAMGDCQLVFVSGEAGVGKTTVLDLFVARLAAGSVVRIGKGQCVEPYGEGELYLPWLDALGRLGRGPDGQAILPVLRRYAPMWLIQLPGLVGDVELERLQRQVQGATQARMVRELAEALAVLTADTPLVLVLEDLHWADSSTVQCLAYLAQRREPARLLVLGTYCPVEMVHQAHPLRGMVQELCGRGQGVELRLERLPAADVGAYVAGRLGGPVAASLAAFIHVRTDGHALFMVNVVEHLVQQGLLVRRDGQWTLRAGAEAVSLPEGLQQLLMRRIETLPPEARLVLEAASVVGKEFAVAAVAAGAQCPVEDVEVVCEELVAQHHFITDTGLTVWPDGTSSGSYQFQHALYQQALYEQLGSTRRARLHQRIGARLEASYGARAAEIASQLAIHYERGYETHHAVYYLQQVGENAVRRNAHHEAVAALTKGLTLLTTLPDSPERFRHELTLQITLGGLLIAAKGLAAPEVANVYTRALALCQQVGETPQLSQALCGLMQFHLSQAQLRTSGGLGQQLFHLAHRQPDAVLPFKGHVALGAVAFYRGDLVTAHAHLEQSLRLYDIPPPSTLIFRDLWLGHDPMVMARAIMALALWEMGYADQAQQRSQEALALAQQGGHVPSLLLAELFATQLSHCRRDMAATQAYANALIALGVQQGFTLRWEQGRLFRWWVLAMQGDAVAGVTYILQSLAVQQSVGPKLMRPYFLSLLAKAYGQAGQPATGLTVLAEALTLEATTEERWWEAELHCLKGALLLQLPIPDVPQAEASLHQALDVARSKQAKALELRAALSLSRLWQQHGRRIEARELLAPIYGGFTEGFDTADLQEARALLDALA